MRILFVGDILGPEATRWLADRLPELRRQHGIDLAIANAENCHVEARAGANAGDPRHGFGMDPAAIELLLARGIDVITSGNHAWDRQDAALVLADPRVARPHNLPPGRPGQGVVTVTAAGEPVAVVNLAERGAIADALPAWPAWEALAADLPATVVVDFHGESAHEKIVFAHAVDGRATAVLGTHTHEPTLRLHRLPGGTALVTDVGATGPVGGVQGIAAEVFVGPLRGDPAADPPPPLTLAPGPPVLGAVVLTTDRGRTTAVERVW